MQFAYSSIIQDFAMPLLEENDSKEILQLKFNFAELVWNYCITKELKLQLLCISIKQAIDTEIKNNVQFSIFFGLLVKAKKTYFSQYKNYLVRTEVKQKSDGSMSVFCNFIAPKDLIISSKKVCEEFFRKNL